MTFGLKINPFTDTGIPSFKLRFEIDLTEMILKAGIPWNFQFGMSGGRMFKIFAAGQNALLETAQYAATTMINGLAKNFMGYEKASSKNDDKKNFLDRSFELIKLAAITTGMIGFTHLLNNPLETTEGTLTVMAAAAILLIFVHVVPLRAIKNLRFNFPAQINPISSIWDKIADRCIELCSVLSVGIYV